MYKEGRQFVVDAKKEIDGVVGDLKGIQEDAKGVWGFLTGLFGGKKKEIAQKKNSINWRCNTFHKYNFYKYFIFIF